MKVLEPVEREIQQLKAYRFPPSEKKEKVKACLSRERKEEKKKRNYIEIKANTHKTQQNLTISLWLVIHVRKSWRIVGWGRFA